MLGFRTVDAQANEVHWRLYREGRHGIKNLKFGNVVTDIVYGDLEGDGADGMVNVVSNRSYALIINGRRYNVRAGRTNTFSVSPVTSR